MKFAINRLSSSHRTNGADARRFFASCLLIVLAVVIAILRLYFLHALRMIARANSMQVATIPAAFVMIRVAVAAKIPPARAYRALMRLRSMP